jgi:manganese/iron transport system ATP-binding protein
MLEVRNLAVRYRNYWAVRDISFTLRPGQITGLLGPNGAGKSSLLKGMLGLISITQGNVLVEGKPVRKQLQRIAYVPQRSQLDWDYPITVRNVVRMGRIRQTGWFRKLSRQSEELVASALDQVGMSAYGNYPIGELSGGQQQRVFLARAIAQQADIFCFDEPFTGVDQHTEKILLQIFVRLKGEGKTLLIISHDFGETLDYYDQLLLLNRDLIAVGSPVEVLTTDNLKAAYSKPRHRVTA